MFPQPVGMPFDLDDDGMVQQAVQQRGGHDDVTEDGAPVLEAARLEVRTVAPFS